MGGKTCLRRQQKCLLGGHMKIRNTLLGVLFFATLLPFILSGCERSGEMHSGELSIFTSYRDIPGVTEEEVAAIEALRERRDSFVYGVMLNTEAFLNADNEIKGFSDLLSEWLTALLRITFVTEIHNSDDLLLKLNAGELDFVNLQVTEEHRTLYIMSDPIAVRMMKIMRIPGSRPLEWGAVPRYVFLEGSPSFSMVSPLLSPGSYEAVFAVDHSTVYQLMKNGEADAFIGINVEEAAFDRYGGILVQDFYPLLFSQIAMATANPDLQPIISIVTKALKNGAIHHINALHRQGYQEYMKHKLFTRLTEEERNFIKVNPIIPFVANTDNYPVNFYNVREGEYQGIFFEVLREVELLTGLEFLHVNDQSAQFPQLLQMLEEGEALIFSEVIRTPQREGRFLWPNTAFMANYPALISRIEHPFININEVYSVKVGLSRGTGYTELFHKWFPGHGNVIEYESQGESFKALLRGEVDMTMNAYRSLPYLTNYLERPYFKANIVFDYSFMSASGFNLDAAVLCSIFDKALELINVETISRQWLHRAYDHRARLAEAQIQAQRPWIIGTGSLFLFIIITLTGSYIRSIQKNKTIAEQSSTLTAIYDSIPAMVYTKDLDGRYTSVNRAITEEALFSHSEMLGKTLSEVTLCDKNVDFDVIDSELKVINEHAIVKIEKWYDYPDKSRRAREITTAPIVKDDEVVGLLGIIMDITERKMAEEALKEANHRIEAIINNLPGSVFQCYYDPPHYTTIFVSEGIFELTGYTPEEYMNPEVGSLVHPDDAEYVDRVTAEALSQGLHLEACYRIITKSGAEKWIWERCRALERNPDGTPRLIEGYYTDITEQRKLETAESANRAKSEFLAVMAHEIRTPMNSIMGFAELALSSASLSQTRDYLAKIADSTKWLLHIINDILDISKIESGKLELENVPFDLHEVISRCQSVILPSVKEKSLELRLYAEPLTGKKLLGDPVRLYQVLTNLLSNAVKFTDAGTVTLSALIKSSNDGSATVYFEIKDTGIGMNSEQIAKILDPFTQADSSTTRKYGGTGLGLTIVKKLVELMGGKPKIESSPGVGSTFSFEITFGTIDAADGMAAYTSLGALEKPCFDGLILVCDDNVMNQEVMREHLANVGLRTVAAGNGKAGLEIVQQHMQKGKKPFDLILMDIFMPVMDGIEAASKITALNTGSPIVAVTANVMASELEKYRKCGMADFLGKPFTSQELWRILLKYLSPLSCSAPDAYTHNGDALQKKLRLSFIKNNRGKYAEITGAIAAGDLKLAHRLVHSVKGNAGFIRKTKLQEIAGKIEALLQTESPIPEALMNRFEIELALTLEELGPLLHESAKEIAPLTSEQALALFEELEPMLENRDPSSIKLIDKLRAVPGAEELVRQIESFDLKFAQKTLAGLKKSMI